MLKTKALLLLSLPLFGQIYELDTVFVTAKRYKEGIRRVAQPSTIISKEEIRFRTTGDIASALKYEPNLEVRSYSFLKGLSTLSIQGSSAAQVLSQFAGMPLNSPATGVTDLGLIPTFFLSKVEVIKGPSSGIHGANALAGVANFLPAVEALAPQASILYGSNRTFSQSLSGKYSFGKLSLGGGLENFSTKGMRKNDDLHSLQTGLAISYEDFLSLFSGFTLRNTGVCGPIPDSLSIPKEGDSLSSSLYDRQRDTFYFATLNLDKRIGKTAFLANTFINKSIVNFYDVSFWDTIRYEYKSSYHQGSFGLNLSFASDISERVKISGGGDVKEEFAKARDMDTTWRANRRPFGIFSTLQKNFGNFGKDGTGSITTFLTLRYDRNSRLSPALGVLITPLKGQVFKFYYGRGFRAPTFNDLYFPYFGNPRLKPEFGSGLELGYQIEGRKVFFELNLFSRRTFDLIRWAPAENGFFWRPKNLDTALVYGIEGKARIGIGRSLQITLGGNLSDGYELKERRRYPLTVVPNVSLSSEIFYRIGEKTNLYLSFSTKGRRRFFYAGKEKSLRPYYLVNLAAQKKVAKFVWLVGRAENLLGKSYALNFGTTLNDRDYPSGGRKFFFGLELRR